MRYRSISLVLVLALVLPFSLVRLDRVTAQGGTSSCMNCHEIEAKDPINDKGAWHIQHTMTDMCSICHGGDPQASDQAAAHAGLILNPLTNASASCLICHPDDFQARADQYAVLLETVQAQATPTFTVTPQASPTPTAVATEKAAPQPGNATLTLTPAGSLTPTSEVTATPGTQPTAAVTPVPPAGGAGLVGGMGWFGVLRFARGPLFRAALIVFALGMLYRLLQVLRPGWKHRRSPAREGGLSAVGVSFLHGLLILPYLPGLKGTFRRSALTYVAGGLFHLALLSVVFFSRTHMLAWKGVIGFGWQVLPQAAVDWLAAAGIVAMAALLINRLVNPVLRLISGPAEWLNWLFVFLPMFTGFLIARKLWLPYEVMFSVHMLLVDFLLIWIPFSRISHFLFYFFSRTIHGLEFGRPAIIR